VHAHKQCGCCRRKISLETAAVWHSSALKLFRIRMGMREARGCETYDSLHLNRPRVDLLFVHCHSTCTCVVARTGAVHINSSCDFFLPNNSLSPPSMPSHCQTAPPAKPNESSKLPVRDNKMLRFRI
jgi:hypothetical protein